jgi:hypothetical protein
VTGARGAGWLAGAAANSAGEADVVAEESGSGTDSPLVVMKTVPLPAHKRKANARTVQI